MITDIPDELADFYRSMPPKAKLEFQQAVAQRMKLASQSAELKELAFRPYDYIVQKLRWTPWDGGEFTGQVQIIEYYQLALQKQKERQLFELGDVSRDDLEYYVPGEVIQNWISIDAGHTVGKCVAASEHITLANGDRPKAGELVGQSFELLTLKNKKVVSTIATAEFNTTESVYRITTSTGKEIVRNFEHPLWVANAIFENGKRPKIAAVGWKAIGKIELDQLVAVTDILPAFGKEPSLSDDEIKMLAYLIGDGGYTKSSVVFSQQKNVQLEEVFNCVKRLGCIIKYKSQYDYSIVGPAKSRKNPIIDLLRTHGLMGKHSRDKFIPPEIFSQPKDKISLFLSRLFSTDGWASLTKDGKQKEIGFCSASEQLIRDIQELLIRFGIHACIYPKAKVNAWILSIKSAENIISFCKHITIYGKEENQYRVYQTCLPTVQRKLQAVKKRPDRPSWRYKNALPGTIWEKIVSVERIGIQPTVAIEVPNYHTYLTMFFEHNTHLAAGLVSHFFDCFQPSIVYCFAPQWPQINDLLFKDIRTQRDETDLPGNVLARQPRINYKKNHFVIGKTTHNSSSDKVQGQHSIHMMFVVDEAEGVQDYVYEAIRSMASGGLSIVLVIRNPETTICRAHQIRSLSHVKALTISCMNTPNVIENKDIYPGMVRRDYIVEMLENTDIVDSHNPDEYTFELPWQPGTIYRPQPEFLWRIFGIASEMVSDNTFCPYGRYDGAVERGKNNEFRFTDENDKATIGVDAARFGGDFGTVYIRRGNWLWRSAAFQTSTSFTFYNHILEQMELLVKDSVVHIEVRVDAGGGWGSGLIDLLNNNLDLQYRSIDRSDLAELRDYASSDEQKSYLDSALSSRHKNKWSNLIEFKVYEVNFNAVSTDPESYYNLITEMYYSTGQAMKVLNVRNAPKPLRSDMCERTYSYGMKGGYSVKVLTNKDKFKDKVGRSPDDGDGAVLAVSPSNLFYSKPLILHAG